MGASAAKVLADALRMRRQAARGAMSASTSGQSSNGSVGHNTASGEPDGSMPTSRTPEPSPVWIGVHDTALPTPPGTAERVPAMPAVVRGRARPLGMADAAEAATGSGEVRGVGGVGVARGTGGVRRPGDAGPVTGAGVVVRVGRGFGAGGGEGGVPRPSTGVARGPIPLGPVQPRPAA
jgi:hypothetical protein